MPVRQREEMQEVLRAVNKLEFCHPTIVKQRAIHLLKPMWVSVGHHHHVALADATALAAFDFFAANFIRPDGLRQNTRAADPENAQNFVRLTYVQALRGRTNGVCK